jgi:murein DD-endopeptidase MepM/ murein hydrolase activator NlpD
LRADEHFAYHRPVLAPASGKVLATVCVYPDMDAVSAHGAAAESGENYIVLDHQNGERSYLGGLAKDSAKVFVGMSVTAGTEVAMVGNSGSVGRPSLVWRVLSGEAADSRVPVFLPFTLFAGGKAARVSTAPETGDVLDGGR